MPVSDDVLRLNPQLAAALKRGSARLAADTCGQYDSQLEHDYAQQLAVTCGADRPWHYHGLVFVLADGKRYTPDFDYQDVDGVTCIVETKGSRHQKNARDSYTRWCVAAGMYPQFRWQWVEKVDGVFAVIEERGCRFD